MPSVDASNNKVNALRVHLTNVTGLGAVQLVTSLLPALEALGGTVVKEIFLPDEGELSQYRRTTPGPAPTRYRRWIPNGLSRVLECSLLGSRLNGLVPLLVLGDVPIRCNTKQTVFVQTPLLTRAPSTAAVGGNIKYRVARALFRQNAIHASAFIVQTPAMKEALTATYPEAAGRVHTVAQPVPSWLMGEKGRRTGAVNPGAPLRLLYPAFDTPRKNHELLRNIAPDDARSWPVSDLTMTIPVDRNPNPSVAWLRCVGVLPPGEVLRLYMLADALVYLSLAESYGFPLVEAMWVGLPIICPDRPYARTLCGNEAIYFDPEDVQSLRGAVAELQVRLDSGWWPSWASQLKNIPSSWDEVARSMVEIAA